MNVKKRIIPVLAIIPILSLFLGCSELIENKPQNETSSHFTSFRNIPGITEDEIAAIEELQKKYTSFTYGITPGTEAFINENDEIGGFNALFCEYLGELFGIKFNPEFIDYRQTYEVMTEGEMDFSDEIKATQEHRQLLHMTENPIAQRTLIIVRLKDAPSIGEIALERSLRYAFLENTAAIEDVASALESGSYETVIVEQADIYETLKSSRADGLIMLNISESLIDSYDDLVVGNFYPLIISPVSLTTGKEELSPIISCLDKALNNGDVNYLSDLYEKGYSEYKKNKFLKSLSEEEREYIKNHSTVMISAVNWFYPICFYNWYENQWEGIAFDAFDELTKITGINFVLGNGPDASWAEIYEKLESGEIPINPDLIYTADRAERYVWSKHIYLSEKYALVSKQSFPDININKIPYSRVGLMKSMAYTEMFNKWFPNASNATEYDTQDDAFNALDKGEIDLIMTGTNTLLSITNYYEFSNYKANFIFDSTIDYSLAFNKKETVLFSVIEKALLLVDMQKITKQWESKTYDYKSRLLKARQPWLIGIIVMSVIILVLVTVFLIRSSRTGAHLNKLVKERTRTLENQARVLEEQKYELMEAREAALAASRSKSSFLANMSHEIRTPLNVIIGLTDLVLEENQLEKHVSANMKKISGAGSTLLSIVNDVLDISKIESGKLTLMPTEYYLASILNDVTTLVTTRLSEKPVEFRLNISSDLPSKLYGDDLRVKQIMNNLLSNAVKHTLTGTIDLTVNCTADKDNVTKNNSISMEIIVSDTGSGIREEEKKNLFTDYYQIDSMANRSNKGTGLGLSITKRLTEMMDVEVSFQSKFGEGSTFRALVKQGFAGDEKISEEIVDSLRKFQYTDEKQDTVKKLERIDLSDAKVLVVDDMQTNLDVAAGLLRKYKMQVDCVTSGLEAVERVKFGKPHYNAIFMDHMMPGMDGLAATDAIRALDSDYARLVPVIALTANAIQGAKDIFDEHDFQDFIAKPIDIMNLDRVVRKWVRSVKSER